MNHDAYPDSYIRSILHDVKTIALVGVTDSPVRASNIVARYLVGKGYRVVGLARRVSTEPPRRVRGTFDFSSEDRSSTDSEDRSTDFSQNARSWGFGGRISGSLSKMGDGAKNVLGGFLSASLSGGIHSSRSESHCKIRVVNENASAVVNSQIDITGRVRIDFITDYFPSMPESAPATQPALVA